MKRLEANKWTETFKERWGNKDRSLNIEDYEFCLNEWQRGHEKKMIKYYTISCLVLWNERSTSR